MDYFENPQRRKVEALLTQADEDEKPRRAGGRNEKQYRNRIWMTRPRPGIDRVSSAWLIRKFIDPKARFGQCRKVGISTGKKGEYKP